MFDLLFVPPFPLPLLLLVSLKDWLPDTSCEQCVTPVDTLEVVLTMTTTTIAMTMQARMINIMVLVSIHNITALYVIPMKILHQQVLLRRMVGPSSIQQQHLADVIREYVTIHKQYLHRVDAWFDVSSGRTVYSPTPTSLTLRVGDLLSYYFWHYPVVQHVMMYVGGGYIFHFIVDRKSRRAHFEFKKLDDTDQKMLRKLTLVQDCFRTHLSRFERVVRCCDWVGEYLYSPYTFNCEHMFAALLDNPIVHSSSKMYGYLLGVVILALVSGLVALLVALVSKPRDMRAVGVSGGK